MPLYEYRCQSCEKVHEILQKISERPKRKCPGCGGRLEKLVSRSGFVLKGAGWYVTDYARKGKSGDDGEKNEKSSKSSKTSKNAKSDDTTSDTTPASDSKGKEAKAGSST